MNVKTAARTLDLFEAFATTKKPLNLSELANVLKIPVSSCFALVRTLENRGYVYMLASRKGIYPTKRILDVANQIALNDPVLERVEPALSALRDTTGETIVLSKRQGDHIVYLDVYDSSSSIRYNTQVGEFKMLHTSSAGKAFLGAMEKSELDKTLAGVKLTRLTPATLTTRKALQADLDLSRERGWYCNISESVADLIGLAVTVSLGGELYGISIAGPVYRMKPALQAHVKALLKARNAIQDID
ncbi:IclR family transcriptional regulator [Pollutimonas bauzanensis]|jgi:DNA-binding IclR family transcriptional regulator|uniref:IclR family transcriptional regulator n=1 Tax=Pollutimonas bauzanensis TaxID=658167 RepID=UPI003340EFEC